MEVATGNLLLTLTRPTPNPIAGGPKKCWWAWQSCWRSANTTSLGNIVESERSARPGWFLSSLAWSAAPHYLSSITGDCRDWQLVKSTTRMFSADSEIISTELCLIFSFLQPNDNHSKGLTKFKLKNIYILIYIYSFKKSFRSSL